MQTIYDFNQLDDKGKGDIVFSSGTFIDDRKEDNLNIQLYRIFGFYVEVFYDPLSNAILKYQSFSSLSRLSPYINIR